MATPNPSLGIAVTFPTATVRNALLFAMQMGRHNTAGQEVTFIKKGAGRRYFLNGVEQFQPPVGTLRLDRDGKPLNPQIITEQTEDELIAVDCAIEVTDVAADELPVGNFKPVKAEITVMEEEYQQIASCREMTYNGDRYGYSNEPEAPALFDQNFHVLVFYALDDT